MKKISYVKIISSLLILMEILSISPARTTYAVDQTTEESQEEYEETPDYFTTDSSNQETASYDDSFNVTEEDLGPIAEFEEYEFPTTKVEDRIIFNPTDQRIIDTYKKAYKAVPDLYIEREELAKLTGRSLSDLENIFKTNHSQYLEIVASAESRITTDYIKEKIIGNPEVLADTLGLASTVAAMQELKNNRSGVEAQLEKILSLKIDKRVIETLNYLVRPKSDPRGGAGHWKIKVKRIFADYTREQTKKSDESDSIYDAISSSATDTTSTTSTTTSSENESSDGSSTTDGQKVDDFTSTKTDDSSALTAEMTEAGATANNTLVTGEIIDSSNKTVADFLIPDKDEEKNVSSHFKGQAVDISEIDDVRCTVIKLQRIGPRQLEPRAPISIKLGWQTQSGYAQDSQLNNSSYSRMFLEMGQDAMLDVLSDLNVDFSEIDSIDVNNFSGIAGIIGQAFFADAINGPSENIWKFDLGDVLNKMGGVIIADELGLAREPFLDTNILSIDNLYEAIGRYSVENNLELPYRSMAGDTRWQMMVNIGKGRFIRELLLPDGALDATISSGDEDSLMEKIGSRIFEDTFSFPEGSLFGKENMGKISESVGSMKFNAVISNPDSLDRKLYLTEGTSAKFKSQTITPREFFIEVAHAQIYPIIYAYPELENLSPSRTAWEKRDEALNLDLPTISNQRSIDRFLSGNFSDEDYYNLGIYTLADSLEKQDAKRTRLISWLNNPTSTYTIQESVTGEDGRTTITQQTVDSASYASTTGVNAVDLFQLLCAPSGGKGIFINRGRIIFANALKDSGMVRRTQATILEENPSLARNIEDYEFIMNRIGWIKEHKDTLQRRAEAIISSIDQFEENELPSSEKEIIKQNLRLLSSSTNGVSGVSSVAGALQFLSQFRQDSNTTIGNVATIRSVLANANTRSGLSALTDELNAFQYELEMVSKWAYEAVTGKEQPNWRVGDTNVGELASGNTLTIGDIQLSAADLALFLSGKVKMKDFLLTLGSAKLAGVFNLPPKALKYAAQAVQALFKANVPMKDVFFRSVGLAAFETQYTENTGRSQPAQSMIESGKMDKTFSANEIRDQLMTTQNLSRNNANEAMLKSFGLGGYDFDKLTSDNDAVWLSAREDAEKNDQELSLPIGTTENFMRGRSEGGDFVSSISSDEIRKFSSYANISETSLQSFLAVKNGGQASINQIYYVDNNPYQDTSRQEDGTCLEKQIPDGSYVYYDSLGLHTFNSFAAANEYEKANQDKKIDYITEISNAIATMIGDGDESKTDADSNGQPIKSGYRTNYIVSQARADIESFISDQSKKYAFGTQSEDVWEGVSTLTLSKFISSKYKIPEELFIKIFSREESAEATVSQKIDIFKVIGYQLVKTYAADFLGQQIGINIGSARITADDVFDIFNGNSLEVFARIGSEILGEQLNVSTGVIREIIEADTAAESECAIYNAASGLLGNVLHINNLSVYGAAFNENFARQKIEQLLGIPKNSFKGEIWDDLLSSNQSSGNNGISISDFYRAFQIPTTSEAKNSMDQLLQQMGANYYKSYKDQSVYQKMTVIYQYIEALSTDISVEAISIDLALKWNDLDQLLYDDLNNFLRQYMQNSYILGDNQSNIDSFKNYFAYGSYNEAEVIEIFQNFCNRLTSIDSALSLDQNSMVKMLKTEENKGPNWIISEVKRKSIEGLAFVTIKNMLGLGESLANSDDFDQFKKDMGICGPSIGFGGGASCGFNVVGVYSFLDKLFNWRLDSKAKLPSGTISRILRDPSVGIQIALQEGAKAADKALGLVDDRGRPYTDGSISAYVGLFSDDNLDGDKSKYSTSHIAEDSKYCSAEANAGRSSYSNCMSDRADMRKTVIRNASSNLIQHAFDHIDGDGRVAGVRIYADGSNAEGRRFAEEGISVTVSEISGLLNGDFRFVEAVCIYSAIKNYITRTNDDGSSSVAVPQRMLFQYQDVYRMIYGNGEMEEIAREAAQGYTNAVMSGSITDIGDTQDTGTNGALLANLDRGTNSSVPLLSDMNGDGQIDIDDTALAEINATYPLSNGTTPTALGAAPTLDGYGLSPEAINDYYTGMSQADFDAKYGEGLFSTFDMRYGGYLTSMSNWQAIRDAGDSAASRVRELYRQNFEARAADCVLYKVDPNIPAGFYWSMMHGNGYSKTVSIVTYITNILRSNELLPQWADENISRAVIDYINNPSHGEEIFERVAEDKIYSAVDQMLSKINVSVMGIDFGFESGTAEGIYEYLKNGGTTKLDKAYGGQWLASKVFSFADQKLKLPAGTSLTMYNSVRSYMAAQKLNSLWKMPIGQLQQTTAYQEMQQSMPSASADEIQKSGQQAASRQLKEVTAAAVSFIVNLVFSKEIQAFEEQFGLVPGTGPMLVAMLVQALFGLPVSPMQIAMFVITNLFGVYKVKYICSSNGTYPDGKGQTKTKVAYDELDYTGFDDFNGADDSEREKNFIKIAQYKADRLALDLYEMPYRTGETTQVPLQVMTGRTESAVVAKPLVLDTVCKNLGIKSFAMGDNGLETAICAGSRVGIWQNPQTTAYTHIGF